MVDGHLQPLWFQGDDIPAQLVDVCLRSSDDFEEEDDDDESLVDVDEMNSDFDLSDSDEDWTSLDIQALSEFSMMF